MKEKILERAKEDIPLYFDDFKRFWDSSIDHISDEDLTEIYNATLIYKNWKIALNSIKIDEFNIIINEIFEDINSSLFLSIMGLYRSSHMHLRSSIELTMQLIFFIHHPIEFIRWKEGEYTIKHTNLADYLVSHPLIKEDIKPLVSTISKNWKKFSKHIHGESPIFFQCEKGIRKTNTFTVKDYNIWKQNYIQNIYNLNKLLLFFFKDNINQFPSTSRDILIALLKDDDLSIMGIAR